MKKRAEYLDIAKGIGILLVVSAYIFEGRPFELIVYSFHMPLFLIISGMLLNMTNFSEKPCKKFFVSKFKSLMIPYIVTELICIPLFYLRGGYGVESIFWIIEDSVFLYVTKGSATWFLLGLFMAEIIYYLLVKYVPNRFVVMAVSLAGYIASVCISEPNHHVWLVLRSLHMMFFVMLGHQFISVFKAERKPIVNLLMLIVFVPSALLNGGSYMVNLEHGNMFFYTLNAILGSALLISLCQYLEKNQNKILGIIKKHFIFWGKETVIVICTHLIIMRYGIDVLLNAGPHYSFVPASIIFFVVMALTYLMIITRNFIKSVFKRIKE